MPNNSYWQKRQEQKYLTCEKKINAYYKELENAFEQSKREIQSVINDFYMRYADENKVSFADAQKLLSRAEIGDLQAFIDKVYENMGKYNLELNNMSIKARITRYQALEKQIDATLQQLYAIEYEYKGNELMKDVYSDSYYRTWYNIDVYKGFHAEFAQVNPESIEELINYPFNGANFSTRLWKQKDHMLQQLNESITTMLIRGESPKELSKDFAKKFNTKEYEAYRLLHTEGSFIIEQGTLKAYKEDEVEKYEILATLDSKTSEICREQDGKIYLVDKAVTGVNYPPFHVFCRTDTVPYYDDVDTWLDERVARDPETGESYKVWADTTYPQWYEKYVRSKEDIPEYEDMAQGWIDDYKKSKNSVPKYSSGGIIGNKKWLDAQFSSDKKFKKHLEDHLSEYGDITSDEYLSISRKLLAEPLSSDVEGFISKIGFVFKYRKSKNDFTIGRPDGYISTLFKPVEGYEYYLTQIKKFKED